MSLWRRRVQKILKSCKFKSLMFLFHFKGLKPFFFYKKYTTYLRVSSKEDIKLQSCLVLKFLVNLDPD